MLPCVYDSLFSRDWSIDRETPQMPQPRTKRTSPGMTTMMRKRRKTPRRNPQLLKLLLLPLTRPPPAQPRSHNPPLMLLLPTTPRSKSSRPGAATKKNPRASQTRTPAMTSFLAPRAVPPAVRRKRRGMLPRITVMMIGSRGGWCLNWSSSFFDAFSSFSFGNSLAGV